MCLFLKYMKRCTPNRLFLPGVSKRKEAQELFPVVASTYGAAALESRVLRSFLSGPGSGEEGPPPRAVLV